MTKKRIPKGRQAHVRGGVQSAEGDRGRVDLPPTRNTVIIIFGDEQIYSRLADDRIPKKR